MKTLIFSVLALASGFAGGYYTGFAVTKKKYRKIADDEVESVKKALKDHYEEMLHPKQIDVKALKEKKVSEPKMERVKPDVPLMDKDSIDYGALKDGKNEEEAYKKYVKQYKPTPANKSRKKEEMPEDDSLCLIRVLSPEEFADSEYDVQTLNYYADGILADDNYNIIKDVKGTIGNEALSTFGMYEEDVVYVRNEKHKIDYEVLFNEQKFSDVGTKETVGQFPGDDD